ncbi:epoxide hydrolase family protein [Devosia nitrariae]|uniref:Hydrolase n=1 Tax=Devosia nitrariae TaxID=2071872 RepID=A0ABQ5WAN0_9HYPH|nr:epoxide hydrolase family protein [Devosia nitrariae]GLQ57126.1 hydrolase [Devosia nitrariae]
MTMITPFTIDVSDADLDDLRTRLDSVRWARPDPAGDWSRGVPRDYIEALARYWVQGFDWRKHEAALNRFAQFTTEVDGQPFHFVHVRSPHENALPLVLCHGWPGSFVEFQRLIGPLTDPVAFGGDAVDAFDVIVPSLPGFGYSTPLTSPGWDLARTTSAYAEIMARLGYSKYGAHGSDIGAGIAGHLASFHPDRVVGVHVASDRGTLNAVGTYLPMPEDLTDEEKAELEAIKAADRDGDGYARQQGTKPQTLAYGLGDSPAGQLAWIVEKFKEWTNPAKVLPEEAVDRDQLLTNIALYWFTNSAGSSAQFYWESTHSIGGWTAPSDVPTGWAVFNTHPLMRRTMDPQHEKQHWSEFAQGGHFPAMEEPELLVEDIRTFFRRLR